MRTEYDIAVVGAGASGMMAAIAAAEAGAKVVVVEKNDKPGRKIYITGKGRCNFTNACDPEEFLTNVPFNARFLYSAIYSFSPEDAVNWFEEHGMRTKVERGKRVFPESDHASDVTAALVRQMRKLGVELRLGCTVAEVLTGEDGSDAAPDSADCMTSQHSKAIESSGRVRSNAAENDAAARRVCGVRLTDGTKIASRALILATGGVTYPSTGSTGDGYRFAKELGHKVSVLSPSLVPLVTAEADIPQMQGLSLKNVTLTIKDGKKKLFEKQGEMMFTHFGITGPIVLSASAEIQKKAKLRTPLEADSPELKKLLRGNKIVDKKLDGRKFEAEKSENLPFEHPLSAEIDLKSALTEEQLDERIRREFAAAPNKSFHNILPSLYPAKMIPVILDRCGIPADKPVHDVTKAERRALIEASKHFQLTITGLRSFREAVITHGGVSVREVDPSTMESKKVPGLYLTGEVLDVDACTGGFNLQIAWATGHMAGAAAAEAVKGE